MQSNHKPTFLIFHSNIEPATLFIWFVFIQAWYSRKTVGWMDRPLNICVMDEMFPRLHFASTYAMINQREKFVFELIINLCLFIQVR